MEWNTMNNKISVENKRDRILTLESKLAEKQRHLLDSINTCQGGKAVILKIPQRLNEVLLMHMKERMLIPFHGFPLLFILLAASCNRQVASSDLGDLVNANVDFLLNILEREVVINSTDTTEEWMDHVDSVIEEYIEKIFKVQDADQHVVQKRGIKEMNTITRDYQGVNVLSSIEELYNTNALFPSDMTLFYSMQNRGYQELYVAILESNEKSPEMELANEMVLSKFEKGGFREIQRVPVLGAIDIESFNIKEVPYIVSAEYNAGQSGKPLEGSVVYKVGNKHLERVQILNTKNPSDISVWEDLNEVYMAVATDHIEKGEVISYEADSLIYRWLGEHFDLITTVKTYNARCVTPFKIGSTMYLAVANHMNNQEETDIDSEIFQYKLNEDRFVSYQKIRTHAAMDIKFFSSANKRKREHFIVVANLFELDIDGGKNYETGSIIYKYADNYFVPFQSITLDAAFQWLPVMGPRGELVLIAAHKWGVQAFQYDGWRFIKTDVQYVANILGPGIRSIRTFTIGGGSVLAVANKRKYDDTPDIFNLKFKPTADLQNFHSELHSWCLNTLGELESDDLEELTEALKKLPKISDETIHINGNITLENSMIENLKSDEMQIGEISMDEKLVLKLNDISDSLDSIQNELENIEVSINNSMKIHGENYVQGSIKFESINVVCEECVIQKSTITNLNGENLDDFLKNTVNLKEGFVTKMPLEFESLSVESFKTEPLTINDHLATDLVGCSKDVKFKGKVEVLGATNLLNGLSVDGKVDGLTFSPETLLLSEGDQTLNGIVILAQAEVDNLNVKRLNGLDVKSLFDGAVKVHGVHSIKNSATLSKVFVDKVNINGLINGMNWDKLVKNTVKVVGDQTFYGNWTFEELHCDSFVADGTISGLILERDFIYINGSEYKIDGELEFTEPLYIDHLYVDKDFNGISVKDGNLDLLLLESNDTRYVNGEKIFESAHVSSELKILNTFNGKKVSELNSYQVIEEETVIPGDLIIHGNVVINGSLKVNDLRNEDGEYSMARVLEHGVLLESPTLPGSSVTFIGEIEVENFQVEDIDGIKPESWVIKDSDDVQIVTAWKTFKDGVFITDSVNLTGFINGINLVELDKDILKTQGDQDIQAPLFINSIEASSITANTCLFGDYKCEDIMLTNEDQIVIGLMAFKNSVSVQNLKVKNLEVKGLVDGYDFESLIEDTAFADGTEWEVLAPKEFKGKLKFDHVTVNGRTGNLSFDGILSMLYTKQHTIADVSVYSNNSMKIENFYFDGTLDGMGHEDFGNAWLLKNSPQVISGLLTFSKIKSNGDIVIKSGEINGWNLNNVMDNVVMKNEELYLDTVELEEVISHMPVTLEGKLNDLDVTTDIVLEEDGMLKKIVSKKVFLSDLIIDGNLIVEDLGYPVNLEKMCEFFDGGLQSDLRVLVEGNVEMETEPSIKEFNGEDLENLFSISWMKDRDVEIPGHMVFDVMNFLDDVEVKKNVDGIDLKWLSENYLSKTKDQTIVGMVDFPSGVIFEKSVTASKAYVSGEVCGLPLDNLESRVLLDGPEQFIHGFQNFREVIVKGDLNVNGTINGFNLDEVLRWDRDLNVFKGTLVVKGIYANELILGANATIQGVDVSKWHELAVSSKDDGNEYIIKGTKSFANADFQNGIIVEGKVDGLKFDKEHLLLLSEEQTVTGKKIFNAGEDGYSLKVNHLEVAGKLNGVNISEHLENLVYKNEDLVVKCPMEFESAIIADYVTFDDLIQGVNLSAIDVTEVSKAYERFFPYYSKLESMAEDLQKSLHGRAIYLSDFRPLHKFKKDVKLVLPVYREEENKPDFATVKFKTDNEALITIYEWSNDYLKNGDITMKVKNLEHIAPLICYGGPALYLETVDFDEDYGFESHRMGHFFYYSWKTGFHESFRIETNSTTTVAATIHPFYDSCCYFLAQKYGNFSQLLCQTDDSEYLQTFRNIPTHKPIEAAIGFVNNVSSIAVLNEYGQETLENCVEVWEFSFRKDIFILMQRLLVENARSMSLITFKSFSYLAIALPRIPGSAGYGNIRLYRLDPYVGQFTHWEDLEIILPWSVKFSVLPTNQLVLYVSTESTVKPFVVFLYRGVAGFKEFTHSFNAPKKSRIDIFDEGMKNYFITLSGEGRNQILVPIIKGV